jgi:hypothetical protein
MTAVSKITTFLKEHIVGIFLFTLVTGVAGNSIYDWLKGPAIKASNQAITQTPSPPQPGASILEKITDNHPYADGNRASESRVPILRNLPPRTTRGLNGEPLTGDHMGIGVTVEIPAFTALIRKVLRDSPAERAGIRPGMRLAKINQRKVPGWTLNLYDCMDLIRESESPVTLGIDPGDGKVYDVIVYKEPLSVPYP